jgi:superfamily II DNA or RNA helicase/HKD family nuclease
MNEGIYDQLITKRVKQALDDLNSERVKVIQFGLEEADSPAYLARHLANQIKIALQSLPKEERKKRQIEFANDLLAKISNNEPDLLEESILDPAQILKAVHRPPAPPDFPEFPLATSSLIMNVKDEPRLGTELQRELRTADNVLMLVSFIQWRGWLRLKPAFQQLALERKNVRVLTTTYIGASDFSALKDMVSLPNVELRISLDGRRRRLHAKAWLFERTNGFSTAYVGSANVSGPALEDGIEWTVKLSEVETPHIVEKFRGAFDSLWADEEFQHFPADDAEFALRVEQSLQCAKGSASTSALPMLFFDLKPHPYQQATLDQLTAERLDRAHCRNLVVAPTGTGKTFLAAFDYKRQDAPGGLRPRLLFLAHREELLTQARDAFRHVLRDESFGEILAGGQPVTSYDYLFSTIQSFKSRELWKSAPPDYWKFAVLDEAHHVTAQSYKEAVEYLRPEILLGLTATPERMDGESILPWFDNRIADEMRLWHAIERQHLAPFDYYGIHDGTDLTNITWSRGSYSVSELTKFYSGNNRRAQLVIKEFTTIYGDYTKARALGFCVSIEHAEFMAAAFAKAEIRAEAVTSNTPEEQRKTAITRLRNGQVTVLFTVDLFNEGVDIPELDCLLFLRPTESATVFLQQLGRGLRLSEKKLNCLVLDFIGNQNKEFRFDLRLSLLFGGTRKQTIEQLESGITALPGNCYFQLDKESQKLILARLKTQLSYSHGRILEELVRTANALRRTPTLAEFLKESQYELQDIYHKGDSSWSSLLAEAGLTPHLLTAEEAALTSRFHFLLHLDSVTRLRFYSTLVSGNAPPEILDSTLAERMALMLTFRLLQAKAERATDEWAVLKQIKASPAVRDEFLQLTACLFDRIHTHSSEEPFRPDQPLYLHRSYQRDEILTAVGWKRLGSRSQMREGILRLPELNTEIFFVTLDKAEKHFSPTTRYEDFAISPTRFHWQSQSTTSDTSPTGQRYRDQQSNGCTFLLFVRANRDEPYVFLGPLKYLSHKGSRPMSIEWELRHPMPAWFFEICASLRAA